MVASRVDFTGRAPHLAALRPLNPGDAEQIQVRVQLRKNNANYGQLSDIVYIALSP